MDIIYIVKTENIITIASDTFAGWRETFEFLKEQGIAIKTKNYSDYMGPVVPSDSIFFYHNNPEECPVTGPSYMF